MPQAKKDQLFISKPVMGRASGKSSVQFTRPFFESDGRFAGVIVVSLDPTHLSTAYKDLNLGDGGLAVVGKDDIIRAGSGIYAASLGRGLREGARHGTEKLTPNGTLLAVEEIDGQVRTLAYRNVGGFPLTVIVAGRDPQRDGTLLGNRHKYVTGATLLSMHGTACCRGSACEIAAAMMHELRTLGPPRFADRLGEPGTIPRGRGPHV